MKCSGLIIYVWITVLKLTVCKKNLFFLVSSLKFACKKMTVASFVYTTAYTWSQSSTNTASPVMLTSCASKYPFRNIQERIVEHMLNLELLLAKRLLRVLSNRQENPALENVILYEKLKCVDDLNRTWF